MSQYAQPGAFGPTSYKSETTTKTISTTSSITISMISLIAIGVIAGAFVYSILTLSSITSNDGLPSEGSIEINFLETGSSQDDLILWNNTDKIWESKQIPAANISNIQWTSFEKSTTASDVIQWDRDEVSGTSNWKSQPLAGLQASSLSISGSTPINAVPQFNGLSWSYKVISDVALNSFLPAGSTVQYMYWSGSAWSSSPIKNISVSGISGGAAPAGSIMIMDSGSWVIRIPNKDIPINAFNPGQRGQLVTFNGSNWTPSILANVAAADLDTTGASTGDLLYSSGGTWVAGQPSKGLNLSSMAISGANTGNVMANNGIEWTHGPVPNVIVPRYEKYRIGSSGSYLKSFSPWFIVEDMGSSPKEMVVMTNNESVEINRWIVPYNMVITHVRAGTDNPSSSASQMAVYYSTSTASVPSYTTFTFTSGGSFSVPKESMASGQLSSPLPLSRGTTIRIQSAITANRSGTPEVVVQLVGYQTG